MKQRLTWLVGPLALLPLLTLPATASASDQATTEQVTSFTVTAQLNRDNVLDVTEQIDYDFGDAPIHPVIRSLPIIYTDDQGNNFAVTLNLLSAAADNTSLALKPSRSDAVARINLPAAPGQRTRQYRLHYTLTPVVVHGYTNDVLKLNVTGGNWTVPIQQLSLNFQAPGLGADDFTCLTMSEGSTSGKCSATPGDSSATATTTSSLDPGESLVITCSFPKHQFKRYLEVHAPITAWLGFGAGVLALLGATIAVPILIARRSRRRRRQSHVITTAKSRDKPPGETGSD
jgi:uncharacterized cupredoxin-like copper-binding protein